MSEGIDRANREANAHIVLCGCRSHALLIEEYIEEPWRSEPAGAEVTITFMERAQRPGLWWRLKLAWQALTRGEFPNGDFYFSTPNDVLQLGTHLVNRAGRLQATVDLLNKEARK